MDELRLARREDRSLVVATESGEEYRLIVDETVLAELRQLSRPARGPVRANPREVQALVRAGKTTAEIAEATGLEESDIARYEEPVLAERRYVLERAQAVPVRNSPSDEEEQQFGAVIAERLAGLGAEDVEWSSWRDDEAGWMIALAFSAGDADERRAVWSFEHRKGVLSPLNPDADSLSKLGSVGDRLIPKLRAVDAHERFDSDAFDPERLTAEFEAGADETPSAPSGPVAPDHPSTGSIPVVDLDDEFARRQHIEERAIKSPAPELPDLGQTADLLDALRRRRGERDGGARAESETQSRADNDAGSVKDPVPFPGTAPVTAIGAASDRGKRDAGDIADDGETPQQMLDGLDDVGEKGAADRDGEPTARQPLGPAPEKGKRGGKGRATIPSWDDILFGTRSDEDPA